MKLFPKIGPSTASRNTLKDKNIAHFVKSLILFYFYPFFHFFVQGIIVWISVLIALQYKHSLVLIVLQLYNPILKQSLKESGSNSNNIFLS